MLKNNNMKVKLKTTEKHFKNGNPGCTRSCVVALALLDSWKGPISRVDVISDRACVIREVNQHRTDYYESALPQKLQELVQKFDEGSLTKKNKHYYKNHTFTLNFRKDGE